MSLGGIFPSPPVCSPVCCWLPQKSEETRPKGPLPQMLGHEFPRMAGIKTENVANVLTCGQIAGYRGKERRGCKPWNWLRL